MHKLIGRVCGKQHIWNAILSITRISLHSYKRAQQNGPQSEQLHHMKLPTKMNKSIRSQLVRKEVSKDLV
jgi:hypothetical protein